MATTIYQQLQQLAEESRDRTRSGPPVIRRSSLTWEQSHHGRVMYISDPDVLGSNVQTMQMFVEELAPGGRNGRHRHLNEALVYILQGKGYSVIGDQRYDWEAGDVIAVPVMEWHQHFNADPDKPVLFLGCTNVPLMNRLGLWQMDDDPAHPQEGHHAHGHDRS